MSAIDHYSAFGDFRFTAPGGWAEFQDFDLQYYSEDGSLAPELAVTRWINELLDGCRRVGREPCPGPKLLGWMRDAGFTQLRHQRFVLPIGTWPKDVVKVRNIFFQYVFILFALAFSSLVSGSFAALDAFR